MNAFCDVLGSIVRLVEPTPGLVSAEGSQYLFTNYSLRTRFSQSLAIKHTFSRVLSLVVLYRSAERTVGLTNQHITKSDIDSN